MQKIDDERLDGWKEIGDYLKRDVRSCIRWEQNLGLPVHRIDEDSPRSKVFALRSEIDHWLLRHNFDDVRERPKMRFHFWGNATAPVLIIGLLGIIVVIIALAADRRSFRGHSNSAKMNPSYCILKGQNLTFYNSADEFLWEKPVDNDLEQINDTYAGSTIRHNAGSFIQRGNNGVKIDFQDVDGDGLNEVLCYMHHRNQEERCVELFDHDGGRIWQKKPKFSPKYRIDYGQLFKLMQLEFEDIDGDDEPEIFTLWHHERRFPSMLLIYDLKGRELAEYANTGQMYFFWFRTITSDKKEILLSGTNNLLNGDAILAVLDCQKISSGLAPPYEIPEDLAQMQDALAVYLPIEPRRAFQKCYLRFKRNELCDIFERPWLFVNRVNADERSVLVNIDYGKRLDCSANFQFDARFRLLEVIPGGEMKAAVYPKLLREAKIEFSLRDFIEKCNKGVLYWDGEGWSERLVLFE
jgi:hypothetical protein